MAGAGAAVGRHPVAFLVAAVAACAFAVHSGVHLLREENDLEALFVPLDSRAVSDRRRVDALFPVNYSDYHLGHETRFDPPAVSVIVDAEGAGLSAFSDEVWATLADIERAML